MITSQRTIELSPSQAHLALPRAGWLVLVAVLLLLNVGLATPAGAAWLRPVEGSGNFNFTCDLVNLPREDGLVDVVITVGLRHREITFENDAGMQRARVRALATLRGPEGAEVTAETTVRLSARNESEAGSPTLHQVFSLALREVPFRHGEFELVLEDLNRRRPGLAYLATDFKAYSQAVSDWFAPPAREPRGLAVGDAVFLTHAPIRSWEQTGRGVLGAADGPWDFSNPLRRYGLEAEALQVYFSLEPPALAADRRRAASKDLRLEVVSEHLDFALVDTVRLTPTIRATLAAGRSAAVYWEMDVGGLPPGSFRLGIAPIDTTGRGLLTGFDVVWRLAQLARNPRQVLGEGRTVLQGEALQAFEMATQTEQELMLETFWKDHDPTPEEPYNPAYAEFQRRISYVTIFLGGFDEHGALDPRGEVYLLLGEPDSMREEPVPMNHQDLEDARIMVYERYAPERTGSGSRAFDGALGNPTQGNVAFQGPIAMPYSYLADVNIRSKKTAVDSRVFQLWRYDNAGRSLFENQYSDLGGGLRFLFVDKHGMGTFVLDATNAWIMGD
jgi:GWxTD domain-containing protein